MSERLELPIRGMTCASCAARVEKRLNGLDGVEATVNYATERASVQLAEDSRDDGRGPHRRRRAGRLRGGCAHERPAPARTLQHDPVDDLRRRLIFAAIASLPLLALGMVPALQFDYWQWISLQLATPVLFWAAWPFHRAAWINLRHGTATMDTLISIGTIAAWSWSLVSLLFLGAGEPGMRHELTLLPERDGSGGDVYFEAVGVVVTFLLAGRWFEARAKRSAGAALRALLELGAKEVSILDADGVEHRIPIEELKVDHRFIVRPGEKVATDGIVYKGVSAIDRSLLTGESVPVDVHPGRGRHRRDGQRRRRPADRARDARRRRHGARADRPARDRGADRQGARAATRRPHRGRVRAGRARDRRPRRSASGSAPATPASRSPPRSRC